MMLRRLHISRGRVTILFHICCQFQPRSL